VSTEQKSLPDSGGAALYYNLRQHVSKSLVGIVETIHGSPVLLGLFEREVFVSAALKAAFRFYGTIIAAISGVVFILLGTKNQKPEWIGIGTSLAAAGIVSVIASVGKYFDDKSAAESHAALLEDINALGLAITGFHKFSIVSHRAQDRCILHRTPREEFESIVKALRRGTRIEIDAMGLTLEKFHQEQLTSLAGRSSVAVRLIVQHPDSTVFKQLAKQESRDSDRMASETRELTRHITTLNNEQGPQPHNAEMQIHWFDGAS
jgi:hypothetical protein